MCRNGGVAIDRTLCDCTVAGARPVALSASTHPQNSGPYRSGVPQPASRATTARFGRPGDGMITRKCCTLGRLKSIIAARAIVQRSWLDVVLAALGVDSCSGDQV